MHGTVIKIIVDEDCSGFSELQFLVRTVNANTATRKTAFTGENLVIH